MTQQILTSANERAQSNGRAFVAALLCLTGYCVFSTLTLPFISSLWLGELPLLAFIQVPKVSVAGWLRTEVVMEAIRILGLSKGSFSPDYSMARPYALAITYLIPMAIIAVISWHSLRPVHQKRGLAVLVFFIAAAIDYVFTLIFAQGQSLTIY